MALWCHLPLTVGAMLKDGIYVSEKTYKEVMQCKALTIDDGLIYTERADIFIEKDIPDGYMVFVSNKQITQIRTFSIEE